MFIQSIICHVNINLYIVLVLKYIHNLDLSIGFTSLTLNIYFGTSNDFGQVMYVLKGVILKKEKQHIYFERRTKNK